MAVKSEQEARLDELWACCSGTKHWRNWARTKWESWNERSEREALLLLGSDLFWLDGRVCPNGQLTCCVYAPALDNTTKVELKGGRALAGGGQRGC